MSSNARKIQQGRQVSSSTASAQFRAGNNAAINGFAASARVRNASPDSLLPSLHSAARAYERSGWEQERIRQQNQKAMWMGMFTD